MIQEECPVFVSMHAASHNSESFEDLPDGSIFDFPARLDVLLQRLGGTVRASTRSATDTELLLATSRCYLQYLKTREASIQKKAKLATKHDTAPPWEYLDLDSTTIVNSTAIAAARSAVGATLDAVEAVLGEEISCAFVCCRPPGHHNGCSESLERHERSGSSGPLLLGGVLGTFDT